MKLLAQDTLDTLSIKELLQYLSDLSGYIAKWNKGLPYVTVDLENVTIQYNFGDIKGPLEIVANDRPRINGLVIIHEAYIKCINKISKN